jgi:hypothetical protein
MGKFEERAHSTAVRYETGISYPASVASEVNNKATVCVAGRIKKVSHKTEFYTRVHSSKRD